MNLSAHQRAALEALRSGPLSTSELGQAADVRLHAASGMMSALRDRGLVSCTGKVGSGPKRFLWSLTNAGIAAIAPTSAESAAR